MKNADDPQDTSSNEDWHELHGEAFYPPQHTDVLGIQVNEDSRLTVDLVYWDGTAWFSSGIPDRFVFPLAWRPLPVIPQAIQDRHLSASGTERSTPPCVAAPCPPDQILSPDAIRSY